jgi:hypothetical protein
VLTAATIAIGVRRSGAASGDLIVSGGGAIWRPWKTGRFQ